MDYVISFVSQKGGVGKSTLARAIAREFHANGFKVKLADMDVQQVTTVNWHARRLNAGLPSVGSVECFRSFDDALAGSADADVLIIDGAGRASKATAEIAANSDLIIQPSSPGIDDLSPAVLLFHELIKREIPRSKLRFALTFVGTAREEEMAREYIQAAGYGVLDGSVEFRPSYRAALTAGRTITETSHKSINVKADKLLQSIIDTLQGSSNVVDSSHPDDGSKVEDSSYLDDGSHQSDNSNQQALLEI